MSARMFTEAEKEFFNEYLRYEDGHLYWIKAKNKYTEWMVGKEAGGDTVNHNGYKTFSTKRPDTGKNQTYLSHRVIYWMMTGEEARILDHIDRDKLNNRIENLRSVSDRESNANAKRVPLKNMTKLQGVRASGSGTFMAEIKYDGQYEYLGVFLTQEDAHEIYKIRHVEIYGEHSVFYSERETFREAKDIPRGKEYSKKRTMLAKVRRDEGEEGEKETRKKMVRGKREYRTIISMITRLGPHGKLMYLNNHSEGIEYLELYLKTIDKTIDSL